MEKKEEIKDKPRIIKANKPKEQKVEKKEDEKKIVKAGDPTPIEAQERLMKIMNDSPTIAKLKGTEWEIRGLKPGVQWLISEEACKIVKEDNISMADAFKRIAKTMPSVVKVLTLALLNDKERIEKEYDDIYSLLMWGSLNMKDWATLLYEVIAMVDVGFFFRVTDAVQMLRQMTSERKMTAKEQKQ